MGLKYGAILFAPSLLAAVFFWISHDVLLIYWWGTTIHDTFIWLNKPGTGIADLALRTLGIPTYYPPPRLQQALVDIVNFISVAIWWFSLGFLLAWFVRILRKARGIATAQ
jgi:hypothetical protein